jgi:hypothetical protein
MKLIGTLKKKDKVWKGINHLAQDNNQWQAVVKTVVNLRVP